jgi:hypothetical protein
MMSELPIDMGTLDEYRLDQQVRLEQMIADKVERLRSTPPKPTCKFIPKYPDMDELSMDDIYPETEEFMGMYELLEQNIHLVNLLERNDMRSWTSKFGAEKQLAGLRAINTRIMVIMSEVEKRLTDKLNAAETTNLNIV